MRQLIYFASVFSCLHFFQNMLISCEQSGGYRQEHSNRHSNVFCDLLATSCCCKSTQKSVLSLENPQVLEACPVWLLRNEFWYLYPYRHSFMILHPNPEPGLTVMWWLSRRKWVFWMNVLLTSWRPSVWLAELTVHTGICSWQVVSTCCKVAKSNMMPATHFTVEALPSPLWKLPCCII